MITGIIGGVLNPAQDKGNGKTATMTLDGLLAKYPHARITRSGRIIPGEPSNKIKIYSNYHVTFADEVISASEMAQMFFNEELNNVKILVDEMQSIVDSHYGVKKHKGNKKSIAQMFIRLSQQSRKRNVEITYTTQWYGNVNNQLRNHTNYLYEPIKYHSNGDICIKDRCKEFHIIKVYDISPMSALGDGEPVLVYPLNGILPFYSSSQIIYDSDDYVEMESK